MPQLIRLYLSSVATGFALSGVFVAGLLWFDVAGLGHLIMGSSLGWLAALMMFVFNGIVFAGVQFGMRIMAMQDDDQPPRGGLRAPVLVPVKVRSRRSR
jgi:hypothetical protein